MAKRRFGLASGLAAFGVTLLAGYFALRSIAEELPQTAASVGALTQVPALPSTPADLVPPGSAAPPGIQVFTPDTATNQPASVCLPPSVAGAPDTAAIAQAVQSMANAPACH